MWIKCCRLHLTVRAIPVKLFDQQRTMKKFALSVLGVSLLSNAIAQQPLNCGTQSPGPHHYNYSRNVISQYDIAALKNAGTTCIPMQAHVVRDSDGSGGISMEDLNIATTFLNDLYYDAGIEFFWKGMPNYANNADLFEFDETAPDNDNESDLVALFTTANDAVNIYFVNNITTSSGFNAAGYAYFPFNSPTSNRIVMRHGSTATTPQGTFSHEFGHYFDLYHTHQGTEFGNTNSNAENVPRTGPNANCDTDGDLLCDTEADPRFNSGQFDYGSCMDTGGETDVNGIPYVHPVDNIMSYYPDQCAYRFTPEQYTRMMQGLIERQGHTAYNLNASPQNVVDPTGLVATWNGGQVDLAWNDNANNEFGYLIERSSTSATSGFRSISYAATGPNGEAFSDLTIQPNTDYWYRVKASNDDCNDYSNVAVVSVGLAYCTPSYYFDCINDWNAIIDEVSLTGETQNISNVNTNCSNTSNYGDYTNMSADVVAGSTYNMTVRALVGGGSYVPSYVQVWVDLNQNGILDDVGETLLPNQTTMDATWSGTINIPATALNGTTRMRVRSWDQFNACSITPCNQCIGGETEDYTLTISGGVSTNVKVSAKVFLEGPFDPNNGLMNDDLRAGALLPSSEPYTGLGYTFVNGGGENAGVGVFDATGSDAIVDWVVLELRDNNSSSTVVYSRSALLQRDGDVVDMDGTSAVELEMSDDDYFLAVRHRNHLGAMAAGSVSLSSSTTSVDFSLPATSTYGVDARKDVSGTLCLWMGNAEMDNAIKYTGSDNDKDQVLQDIGGSVPTNTVIGYSLSDCNMDGLVKYTGGDNDRDPILTNIGGAVPTNTKMEQLP